MSQGLLAEVRAFVAGLRGELPELFKAPPPPAPRRVPRPSVPTLFSERCAHYAPLMGVSPGKVRVKDMRSLWGSCSYRGDLSFNARLLGAPPEVLDYVVVHELAHLRWRGHGRRFWDLVQKFCPEQKARRRWLRANGTALLQELPSLGAADREDAEQPLPFGDVAGQREVEPA
ncbi:M48 family peptidase [bacterium]|nr:MAG: M48 family peptidase [bacterium]